MRKSLNKREFFGLLAGIVFLVFLNFFHSQVKNFFYSFSEPLQKISFRTGKNFFDFFGIIWRIEELQKQNQNLLSENRTLKSQIVELKELEKENSFLRDALNMDLQEEFQLLLANLISKDVDGDFIVINKGLKDGVFKNMVLISQEKVLLGRVEEVFENFSRARLITDKKSSFPAEIQESNVTGIVRGEGNFKLSFDLISQEVSIAKGEKVTTAALENIFPKALFVGEIERIEKSDLQPFQKARIRPAFDLKNLEILFVILNY